MVENVVFQKEHLFGGKISSVVFDLWLLSTRESILLRIPASWLPMCQPRLVMLARNRPPACTTVQRPLSVWTILGRHLCPTWTECAKLRPQKSETGVCVLFFWTNERNQKDSLTRTFSLFFLLLAVSCNFFRFVFPCSTHSLVVNGV
jgi:hypothetical protein